jgi:general secretion pathway protein K
MTRRRRGVALMLVLWLIVVLGTVATGVVAAAHVETDRVANLRDRVVARYAAESGVAAARARLAGLLGATRSAEEQAMVFRDLEQEFAEMRDVALGSARFSVTVVDLNARVDLNAADDVTLLGFFGQFIGAPAAAALVSAIGDWKDFDDRARPGGAEAADYARVGSPFRPPNHPLRRLDELTRIAGFTDSLASAVAPYVTVAGDGKINVNTAPAPVLAAIPRLGRDGARAVLSWRDGGEVFGTTADVFQAFQSAHLGNGVAMWTLATTSTRLLVVARGWRPGSALTHEVQAVYDLTGGRLVLRGWTERDL